MMASTRTPDRMMPAKAIHPPPATGAARGGRAADTVRPARGFALAAVLWLLAGLTVLAAMISQSSQTSAERNMRLKQRADAEQEFLSSRSEALYWLASSVPTQDGYGWGAQLLRVDGRLYEGAGKSALQVQDLRGLLDLNRPDRNRLGRLLLRCGAKEGQTDALLDALEDYLDRDSLKRLNGAEAFDYAAVGLPPPRNGPLLAEPEIWRIHGWAAMRQVWEKEKCMEDVTVRGDARFNIGAASARLLASEDLGGDLARQVMDERSSNESALINILMARQQDSNFLGQPEGRWPGRRFRLTHSLPGMPVALRYEVKLTPEIDGTPWEISAPRRIALDATVDLAQVAQATQATQANQANQANQATKPVGQQQQQWRLAKWPKLDTLTETDKNVITKPVLPF